MKRNNCGNCQFYLPKQISGTHGEVPYDSCVFLPPDSSGLRGRIMDVTRTHCGNYLQVKTIGGALAESRKKS